MVILQVGISVVIVIYLLCGALYAVDLLFSMFSPATRRMASRNYLDLAVRGSLGRNRVAMVSILLDVPALMAAWPVGFRAALVRMKVRTDRQHFALSGLRPPDGRISVNIAIVAFIAAVLYAGRLAPVPLLAVLVWLSIVAVALKEVTYLLSPLPAQLRRASRPPWISFVIIAASDAVALTLATGCFAALSRGVPLDAELTKSAFISLFNAPRNLASFSSLSGGQVFVAILGFLYYVTFLKTLLEAAQFKRTDEDYLALAQLAVYSGEVDGAVRWLGKVGSKDSKTYLVRCAIEIAKGRWNNASEMAGRFLGLTDSADTADNRAISIAMLSPWIPLNDESAESLSNYLFAAASDWAYALFLPIIVADHPSACPVAESVSRTDAPLTFAQLAHMQGNSTDAIQALELARADSDIATIVGFALLFILRFQAAESFEDVETLVSQTRASIPDVQAHVASLPPDDALMRRFALNGLLDVGYYVDQLKDSRFADLQQDVVDLQQDVSSLISELSEDPDFVQRYSRIMSEALKFHESQR